MSRTLVQRPKGMGYTMLREELLRVFDWDGCSALIAHYLEYKTAAALDAMEARAEESGPLWIEISESLLYERMMRQYSTRTIRDRLQRMEQQGVIQCAKSGIGKIKTFLYNYEFVNRCIDTGKTAQEVALFTGQISGVTPEKCPMYTGQISGVTPEKCPIAEGGVNNKVVKELRKEHKEADGDVISDFVGKANPEGDDSLEGLDSPGKMQIPEEDDFPEDDGMDLQPLAVKKERSPGLRGYKRKHPAKGTATRIREAVAAQLGSGDPRAVERPPETYPPATITRPPATQPAQESSAALAPLQPFPEMVQRWNAIVPESIQVKYWNGHAPKAELRAAQEDQEFCGEFEALCLRCKDLTEAGNVIDFGSLFEQPKFSRHPNWYLILHRRFPFAGDKKQKTGKTPCGTKSEAVIAAENLFK